MASHNVPRPATTELKTEQTRLKEQKQIDEYKALVDLIEVKIAERQYTLEVLELTSKLLAKNPEYYTIWNVRRRLLIYGLFSKPSVLSSPSTESQNTSQTVTTTVSSDAFSSSTTNSTTASKAIQPNLSFPIPGKNGTILELIEADLDFIFPLMIQYPKCYWIWNYRLWLLKEGKARLEPQVARELWSRELTLVGKMLTRDSRNFHGWGYRRIVISELESSDLNGASMAESEFEYTTKMIKANLSNFSAWHNRSKLIPRILNERNADNATRRKFLDDEFEFITEAIYTDAYPYAQSVWFYHQFLMSTLIEPLGHAIITPSFTQNDRVQYISDQLNSLKEMLDGAEDCKWIYNALLEYTMAICQIEEREPSEDEKQDFVSWLSELRKLDPLHKGRWDDLGKNDH
ncbi:geranylgeranyl transferase-like protein type II alpha subunit [Bisporella sp. PMI_857]|nr:geranylgeranyl transferase-like protein type II alpha subunit [Bisporella sp. PMI_857]